MIRKLLLPVIFFIFGLILLLIESSIVLPTDSGGDSYNGVNLFNTLFILAVLIVIILFEVRTQYKKILITKYKYGYLVVTLILLSSTAYYWIQYLTWK